MPIEAVNFNGIERINTRLSCNAGACEELINLRQEGNSLRLVADKKVLSGNNRLHIPSYITDYQIYLHNSSKEKYFIVCEGSSNLSQSQEVRSVFTPAVLLYDAATGERLSPPLLSLTNSNEQFLSISSLNNVLIACTTQRKVFFIWQDTEQRYISIKQEDFYIGTMTINRDIATEATLRYPDNNTDSNLVRQNVVTNPYRYFNQKITGQTDIKTYLETYFSQLDEIINNKGYYRGLSFFVFAVKLYDGSYIYTSDIVFCDMNGDNNFNLGSSIANTIITINRKGNYNYNSTNEIKCGYCYVQAGKFKPIIKITNIDTINKLFDLNLIKSIDLFMTRPINQTTFSNKADITTCEDLGINEGKWTNSGAGSFYFVRPKINTEGIKDTLENGVFYKVKSFEKKDIVSATLNNQATYKFEYLIKWEDIKNITTNETLPTNNGQNTLLFGKSYTYNHKQHIYDITERVFEGYDNIIKMDFLSMFLLNSLYASSPFSNLNQIWDYLAIGTLPNSTPDNPQTNTKLFFQIYNNNGQSNEQGFCIEKEIITNPHLFFRKKYEYNQQTGSVNSNNWQLVFILPRLLIYPSIENIKIECYLKKDGSATITNPQESSNSEKRIIYSENLTTNIINGFSFKANLYDTDNNNYFVNKSYIGVQLDGADNFTLINKFNPFIMESALKPNEIVLQANSLNNLPINTRAAKPYTKRPNLLRLTETDNPLIYPVKNSYSFGETTNRIIAISTTTDQMSETKFGTFPLYVFTDEGIFTMEVGNGDIAYSNVLPVSIHKIVNSNVINIGGYIMFVAEDGLNILSGRTIQNITNKVKGQSDSQAIINQIKQSLITHNFKESDFSTKDILTELPTSNFIYDAEHNEVLILCKDYTYTYDKERSIFTKRTQQFDGIVLPANNQQILYKRQTSGDVLLYGLKEEDLQTNKPILIEKPIPLLPNGTNQDLQQPNDLISLLPTFQKVKTQRILIITKPFNLNTRQYKKAERIIICISQQRYSNTDFWLFGTDDGINYRQIKHQSIIPSNARQDIFLSRVLTSFRYAVIVLASNQTGCQITEVAFDFNEVHSSGGIK